MSEQLNMTPELTLTPTAAAVAVPEAPTLTLENSVTPDDVAAAQAVREAQAIQMDESQLSEAERKMVADFSEKIDITDATLVLQYGAGAQKNIASFSENALSKVKTKDLGEVGDALAASRLADGMLLVVRKDKCDRTSLNDALRQFAFLNVKILGVVFNGTEKGSSYHN